MVNVVYDVDFECVEEMIINNLLLLDVIVEFESYQCWVIDICIEQIRLKKVGCFVFEVWDFIGYEIVKVWDWEFEEGDDYVDWLLVEVVCFDLY